MKSEDTSVAIKIVKASTEDEIQYLKKELGNLKKLPFNHPHILPIFGYYTKIK
jgi:hypothetical protein